MRVTIDFNRDPTLERVLLIATLMMLELILIRLIEILSQNRMPTAVEWAMIGATGLLQLVTYILTWARKGET